MDKKLDKMNGTLHEVAQLANENSKAIIRVAANSATRESIDYLIDGHKASCAGADSRGGSLNGAAIVELLKGRWQIVVGFLVLLGVIISQIAPIINAVGGG
jgi:hypothetical protein